MEHVRLRNGPACFVEFLALVAVGRGLLAVNEGLVLAESILTALNESFFFLSKTTTHY